MAKVREGIDLSHWNQVTSFESVKKAGIDFVILKAGGSESSKTKDGHHKDVSFEVYYRLAKAAGLYVGAYYFAGSNFQGTEKGIKDAKHFLNLLQGKQFEYPVCIDVEAVGRTEKAGNTEATKAFCKTVQEAGYYVSIYSSDVLGFCELLNQKELEAYDKWVARWGREPQRVKRYGIWQYNVSGGLSGVSGKVDRDRSYFDFPSIMVNRHLNGY